MPKFSQLIQDTITSIQPVSRDFHARAQLALTEPAADIASTLDEYSSLLASTGFHVYEGELYELHAQLAEREGQNSNRAEALTRALDCYTRFGMSAQANRIAAAIESTI